MIHKTSDVQTNRIGSGTTVWQFCVILAGAQIGKNCNVNCHCFIENDVIIGDNVTIKSGVYLWDGIRIANKVFIGPNVTFVNDKYPRSKQYPNQFLSVIIEEGASIGAGSVIMGGVVIGSYSIVGAGSVVTKDVAPRSVVTGVPAKMIRELAPND